MGDQIPEELEGYRVAIDALDVELIDNLAKRFDIVHRVGELKRREGLSVVQAKRAEEVKDRAAALGEARGLDPQFVRSLYEMMIDHAHVLEHEIVDEI